MDNRYTVELDLWTSRPLTRDEIAALFEGRWTWDEIPEATVVGQVTLGTVREEEA
jgi:hypothetical protein